MINIEDVLINEKYVIKTGTHILVDYFSCSFPFITHSDDSELMVVQDIIYLISSYLNINEDEIIESEYAQLGFKYQYKLGDSITLRLVGSFMLNGYRSCMVELKGEGCREFERRNPKKTWINFMNYFYVNLGASPTRIDLAIDDYECDKITFNYLKTKLDKKLFNTSFRTHSYTIHGSEENGYSIQFGSHQSSQMLVIYEKNKEQLSRKIPCPQENWNRYEMRFKDDKAKDVVYAICKIKTIDDFRKFFMERLYEMLDIKIDTKVSTHNLDRVETDKNWIEFLENVNKSKLERFTKDLASFESYLNYMEPRVAFYFSNLLIQTEGDIDEALIRLYEVTLTHFDNFDKKKLKRYNDYLKESNLDPIEIDDLEEIRFKLNKELEFKKDPPF